MFKCHYCLQMNTIGFNNWNNNTSVDIIGSIYWSHPITITIENLKQVPNSNFL